MTPRQSDKSTRQISQRGQDGRARPRKVVSSLTVEQAAESWLRTQQARGHSIHTLKIRQQAIDKLRAWLRERELSDVLVEITKRQIEEFLIVLHQRFAPNSMLTYYMALARFFNWCVEEEELPYSPMARIPKPDVVETAPTILTAEEVQALLKTCAGKSFMDRRDRAIFLLLIDTGMRLNEIRQLTLDTVDLDTQTMAIVGKGRRPRMPHFDVTAAAALDAYLRARTRFVNERPQFAEVRALWLGPRGALANGGIYQMVVRRAKQAGIEGVHPHLFRHGFANDWLAAGGTEGDLARLAGWTPGSRMLHRYGAARQEERAREAHKRLSPANRLLRPNER